MELRKGSIEYTKYSENEGWGMKNKFTGVQGKFLRMLTFSMGKNNVFQNFSLRELAKNLIRSELK